MFRFIFKTAAVILVLLFGIIIGMQEAHTGMLRMAGYDDLRFKKVLEIGGTGEMEATILGEEISSHHLEEKKRILEEMNLNHTLTDMMNSFNEFLSELMIKILP